MLGLPGRGCLMCLGLGYGRVLGGGSSGFKQGRSRRARAALARLEEKYMPADQRDPDHRLIFFTMRWGNFDGQLTGTVHF